MSDQFSQPSFTAYRSSYDPSSSKEEFSTREELTFQDIGQEGMAQQEDPTQTILATLAALLRNQQDAKTFRPRMREPDTYHGNRALNAAQSWLRSVERYLEMADPGEHQWVAYAATLLRGEAEIWWQQQEQRADISEWPEFKKRLLQMFSPPDASRLARDHLAHLAQTGTVAEYVAQFQAIWTALSQMTDDEAKDRFERGLQPEMFMHVRSRSAKTTDEAMQIALAYESSQQQARYWYQQGVQQQTPQQQQGQYHVPEYLRSSGVAPMDLDAIRSRGPGSSGRSPGRGGISNWRRREYSDVQDKECYNCGGFGHIARNCSSAPRRQSGHGGNGRRQGNNRSNYQSHPKGQARPN